MELEEAKKECIQIKDSFLDKVNSTDPANVYSGNAIETVLQALENSIPKEEIEKKIEEIDKELEEKYSAEKISISSGNTYMEKFKLLGKKEILQELLDKKE